ncbi:MAG: DUF721 domain-containing protein [Fimbriimonadaceae bacterium]|nr:DUF721 domain-containing protein [Fimbriimonadaceae bacterium]
MKTVLSFLSDVIGRPEVLRHTRARRVLREWPRIVGPVLARHSLPERYDHGTVWVAVDSSVWAQELRMQQVRILEEFHALGADGRLIQQLRFGVRPVVVADALRAEEGPRPEPVTLPDGMRFGERARQVVHERNDSRGD